MANVSGTTTTANSANYLGALFLEGQQETPFITQVLGMNKTRREGLFTFPLNANYTLAAAANTRTVSETDSMSFGTPTTFGKSQDTNVMQIEKRAVEVSEKRLAEFRKISGVAAVTTDFDEMIRSEILFQIRANMAQLKKDMEYAVFQSTITAESVAATNTKTRGLFEAISTNASTAGGADLTQTLIDNLLKDSVDNGMRVNSGLTIWSNSFQLSKINSIYGNAPAHRSTGGTMVTEILTAYGIIQVRFSPQVPQGSLAFIDMNAIELAFLHLDGEQEIMYQPKERDAMSMGGLLKSMWGLDYLNELLHCEITGLSES